MVYVRGTRIISISPVSSPAWPRPVELLVWVTFFNIFAFFILSRYIRFYGFFIIIWTFLHLCVAHWCSEGYCRCPVELCQLSSPLLNLTFCCSFWNSFPLCCQRCCEIVHSTVCVNLSLDWGILGPWGPQWLRPLSECDDVTSWGCDVITASIISKWRSLWTHRWSLATKQTLCYIIKPKTVIRVYLDQ